MQRWTYIVLLVLFIGQVTALAQKSNPSKSQQPASKAISLLMTLNPTHPRLILTPKRITELKQLIQTDATAKKWFATLKTQADQLLKKPVSKYEIPDGLRLLSVSRRTMDRTYLLGLIYRLTGDKKYALRLWKELDAVCKFKDWNPRHFLDTAEMTHAVAIGYDWLHDVWSQKQKQQMVDAIVELGLLPAMKVYQGKGWWAKSNFNWNQVCNGGIGIGALAIADQKPELSEKIIGYAVKSLPRALVSYKPDGGWAEGPGYWHYATRYTVYFLASLDSALGNDFGLSQSKGLTMAGDFPIYMVGPTRKSYNYADSGSGSMAASEMWWLGSKYHRPEYWAYQLSRANARPTPHDLIWYEPAIHIKELKHPATAKYFRGVEVVSMRNSWTDPDAMWLAFKGGDNQANHGQIDLGSFVLDSGGQRFAVDLGSDNYNLPGYWSGRTQDGKRWSYYRMRTESHNILLINPGKLPNQNVRAKAKVTQFKTTGNQHEAVVDLTSAYNDRATRVKRKYAMTSTKVAGANHKRPVVTIFDQVKLKEAGEVYWLMHTPAKVKISQDGRTATLTIKKAKLTATIQSPQAARFSVVDAKPLSTSPNPKGQKSNKNIKRLMIHFTEVKQVDIKVRFEQ